MEPEQAKALLAAERKRVEDALGLHSSPAVEGDSQYAAGDDDGEGLYQDELDSGRREDLRGQLASIERAEQRLADGTYGLSVRSGKPIPDARLKAQPAAEMTVEEQRASGG